MKKFKCDECGKEFDDDTPEEDVLKELAENFGEDAKIEDCGVVCDKCYKDIMKFIKDED